MILAHDERQVEAATILRLSFLQYHTAQQITLEQTAAFRRYRPRRMTSLGLVLPAGTEDESEANYTRVALTSDV